jgi:phage shock protein C
MVESILSFFEKQAFGVCAWWGEKLGIKSAEIRLFFIYLSFFTVGSPLIIYLIMAFILKQRRYFKINFRKKRPSVWDL